MSAEKIVHTSFAILPFTVRSSGVADTGLFNGFVTKVTGALKPMVNQNTASIVDTTRYHGYIKNYLSSGEEREAAFLQSYPITQAFFEGRLKSQADKSDKPFAYHPQKHVLKVVNKESNHAWKVEFLKSSYLVLNQFCEIGYFVLGFDFNHVDIQSMIAFRDCEFFRYAHNSHSKHSLHVYSNKGTSDGSVATLTVFELLEFLFPELLCNLYFIGQDTEQENPENDRGKIKPVLLHLIKAFDISKYIDTNTGIQEYFFDLLRIRRIKSECYSEPIKSMKSDMVHGTMVGALNEGAVVMDFLEGNASNPLLIYKYLPAFLFALNQRQTMVYVNQRISAIKESDISNIDQKVIEKFKAMKKEIDILHLKQVFFTISFNDEVSDFYQKIQKAFQINLHLEDNKESVKELYSFLEESRLDRESREQAIRDSWMNSILAGIGCLGIFGFFKDFFPFWEDKTPWSFLHQGAHLYKWVGSLLPLVLAGYLVFVIRKNIK
jgi:hypothetical protein